MRLVTSPTTTTSTDMQRASKVVGALILSLCVLVSAVIAMQAIQSAELHQGFRKTKEETKQVPSTTATKCSPPSCSACIDPAGTWSATTYGTDVVRGWTWHSGPDSQLAQHITSWHRVSGPKSATAKVPLYPPIQPGTISSLLNSENTSLVFYGSSHVREIYFYLLRLELGLEMGEALTRNQTWIPSGDSVLPGCDPKKSGWVSGYYGIDLQKCGIPGRRMIPELGANNNAAIGFKTFLHTPDADKQFLEYLTAQGLRHPEILVMDAGIWGYRGDKLGGSAQSILTPTQEWEYYTQWILGSFPHSHILVVHEKGPDELKFFENMVQEAAKTKTQRVSILRKDILLQKKHKDMPCAHGCSGPVINTLAVRIVEWLQERRDAARCAAALV